MSFFSLLIDTATEEGLIALFDQEFLIAYSTIEMGFQRKQGIISTIDDLFKKTGIEKRDLKFVSLGVGPGSYTGLRVGAIVGKTLSYTAKIPLVGLSTLLGMHPGQPGKFASLLDAKMGGVYLMISELKEGTLSPLTTPEISSLEEAVEKLSQVPIIASPHRKKLEAKFLRLFPELSWNWQEVKLDPIVLGKMAWKKFLEGEISDHLSLELLYLNKI